MSRDYTHLGLDSKLRSTRSLSATRFSEKSAFNFQKTNARGAVNTVLLRDASISNAKLGTAVIGTANIGTLSFNEITGGTATFGGTNDGDGLVLVNDEAGAERVKLDKTGIKVTGGSVIVEDDEGGTIIDSTGIVSTTSFLFSTIGSTAEVELTETVSTAVPGMNFDVVLSRGANVLMLTTVTARSASGGAGANFTVSRGGTADTISLDVSSNDTVYTTFAGHKVAEYPAGTSNVQMRYAVSMGGGTLLMINREVSAIVLGK